MQQEIEDQKNQISEECKEEAEFVPEDQHETSEIHEDVSEENSETDKQQIQDINSENSENSEAEDTLNNDEKEIEEDKTIQEINEQQEPNHISKEFNSYDLTSNGESAEKLDDDKSNNENNHNQVILNWYQRLTYLTNKKINQYEKSVAENQEIILSDEIIQNFPIQTHSLNNYEDKDIEEQPLLSFASAENEETTNHNNNNNKKNNRNISKKKNFFEYFLKYVILSDLGIAVMLNFFRDFSWTWWSYENLDYRIETTHDDNYNLLGEWFGQQVWGTVGMIICLILLFFTYFLAIRKQYKNQTQNLLKM